MAFIKKNCDCCPPSPCAGCCTRQSNAWVESRSRPALSDQVCGFTYEKPYEEWWGTITRSGSVPPPPPNATPGPYFSGTKTVAITHELLDSGACKATYNVTENRSQNYTWPDGNFINESFSGSRVSTFTDGIGWETIQCSGSHSYARKPVINPSTGQPFPNSSYTEDYCPDIGMGGYEFTETKSGKITVDELLDELLDDAIGKLGGAAWTEWGTVSYPLPDECFPWYDWETGASGDGCTPVNGPYASAGTMRPYYGIPRKAGVVKTEYRIKIQIPSSRYIWAKWEEVTTPEGGEPTVIQKNWEKTFSTNEAPGTTAYSGVATLSPTEFLGSGQGGGWVNDLVFNNGGMYVRNLKIICAPPSKRIDYASRSAFPTEPSEDDAQKVHLALDTMEIYKWNGTGYDLNPRLSDCFRPCNSGCTNPDASNYDPLADIDDGSCDGWE